MLNIPDSKGNFYLPNSKLSDRFTLDDLTVTNTGQYNMPATTSELDNLIELAHTLDYLYKRAGKFVVTSAYRSLYTQAALKGGDAGDFASKAAATNSFHLQGKAADLVPLDQSLEQFYQKLITLSDLENILGQVTYCPQTQYIHVSTPSAQYPTRIAMRAADSGQYFRLTAEEKSYWDTLGAPVKTGAAGMGIIIAVVAAIFIAKKYGDQIRGLIRRYTPLEV